MKKAVSLTVLACTLQVGCSVIDNNPIYGESGIIRDRSQDYEKATEGQALEVPPHLRARKLDQGLDIPAIDTTATRASEAYTVPRPEFFYTETTSDKVSLAREGAEKLILVDSPIDQVWPKLKDFWQFAGVELASADARNAVMETAWIKREGPELGFVDTWIKRLTFQEIEGPTKDKLQVTLRPVPGELQRTSIAMKHVRYAADQDVASIDWEKDAQEVGYKSDMMFEMLRYLSKASSSKDEAPTLTKLSNPHKGRTALGHDSRGNPVLKVEASSDEAWTRVSTAMASERFDLGTVDREAGMFYFSYTTSVRPDETRKMGFFEWLHSDKGEIKFETTALAEALGVGEDENGEKIRYTSKDVSDEEMARVSEMSQEELEQEALQKADGYKIWLAGRVVYVFGRDADKKDGAYNAETNAYEFTGRYQLKLNRSRTGIYLTVLNDKGQPISADIAEEILWDVKDNLPES